MAALDGKITIGIGYRPCMVHIPAKTERQSIPTKTMGLFKDNYVEVEPGYEIKALFHCWNHCSELVGESPLRDGHPGGQISDTFAIVEYEDGTVHEVEPQNIRFVDNLMTEYAFPEENKWPAEQKGTGWHCPVCREGYLALDEGAVLTSNPPMYRYVCDKCGHIEFSRNLVDR